eukprot:TRINITY_DN44335_c0_g1_i1.p1 TRINITY_DN44335_c0_g1~~TRINITY_DN44335_c0_g1_i1.p1  ORF type:complete len:443 (+),score=107.74 TRINITY_DN44335_c0_g1_i1:56-1330(+)
MASRLEQMPDEHPYSDSNDTSVEEYWGRIKYAGFLLITFVIGLILRSGDVSKMFQMFPVIDDTCGGASSCLGITAVYRVSFALFIFYLGHLIVASPLSCCIGRDGRRTVITRSWKPRSDGTRGTDCDCALCIKLLLYLILVVASFFIPQDFFKGYAYVAAGCGAAFLCMQSVILIDFAYNWNDAWVSRGEEEPRFFRAIFFVTLLLFGGAIALSGLMFHWFVAVDGCEGTDYTRQAFFVSFNLICGVLYTVVSGKLSASGHKQASILPSSVVFIYSTWQTFSAIMSYSGEGCNLIHVSSDKITFTSVLSICITAIALVYAALSAGFSRSAFSLHGNGENSMEFSFTFFFLCMLMGAGYLAMVLTGWDIHGTGVTDKDGDVSVDSGKGSMWVKVLTAWLTIILYTFSLAAPACCPDRFEEPGTAI